MNVAIGALLAFSVLVVLLAALGIVTARSAFDRLHFVGPAAIFAPISLALAVVLQNGITAQTSVETMLIAVVIIATNPIATHALGRAFRVREMGDLRADAGDEVVS